MLRFWQDGPREKERGGGLRDLCHRIKATLAGDVLLRISFLAASTLAIPILHEKALVLCWPFKASLVAAYWLGKEAAGLGESDPVQGTPREGSPLCSENRKRLSRTVCRQEGENYAGIMARTASTKEQLHSGGSWLTDFPSSCLAPAQFLHRL